MQLYMCTCDHVHTSTCGCKRVYQAIVSRWYVCGLRYHKDTSCCKNMISIPCLSSSIIDHVLWCMQAVTLLCISMIRGSLTKQCICIIHAWLICWHCLGYSFICMPSLTYSSDAGHTNWWRHVCAASYEVDEAPTLQLNMNIMVHIKSVIRQGAGNK